MKMNGAEMQCGENRNVIVNGVSWLLIKTQRNNNVNRESWYTFTESLKVFLCKIVIYVITVNLK